MKGEKNGNTNGKLLFPGLVAQQPDAQKHPEATAEKGKGKECPLRHTPKIFPRPVLIHRHKNKTQRID